jgi:hypothetical protein
MSLRVERRTVDLSNHPDLAVIYPGMRVNRLMSLNTLLRLGPRIARSVKARPDGLLLHENLLWSLAPRMWGCVSTGATSNRSSDGHVLNRIVTGDGNSCDTLAGPASGTRPTSCEGGWRLSTTTW